MPRHSLPKDCAEASLYSNFSRGGTALTQCPCAGLRGNIQRHLTQRAGLLKDRTLTIRTRTLGEDAAHLSQLHLAVKVACHRLQLGQKQFEIFAQGALYRLVGDYDLSLQAVAGYAPLILLRVPGGEHFNAFARLNAAGEVLHQALRERHDRSMVP